MGFAIQTEKSNGVYGLYTDCQGCKNMFHADF